MLHGAYYTQQCTDLETQTADLTTLVLLFNYHHELKLACIGIRGLRFVKNKTKAKCRSVRSCHIWM